MTHVQIARDLVRHHGSASLETRPHTVLFEAQAFSIAEFCGRNRISLSTFHKLKNEGRGPRLMSLGRAIRISIEAERDWRAQREMPRDTETAQIVSEAKARSAIGRRAAKLAVASPSHVSKRGNRI